MVISFLPADKDSPRQGIGEDGPLLLQLHVANLEVMFCSLALVTPWS